MDFYGTNQLLFLYSAFFKCLRKNGIKWSNTSYGSYLQTSRKPTIQLGERYFVTRSLNLAYA